MDPKRLYDAVIVGGGPAGLTAALYLARARYRVLVVEKEKFGGQITITHEVVNYPGVARTSGNELTETMRQQAESFGAEFVLAEVTGLALDGDVKQVTTAAGTYACFGVLLATGANPRSVGFGGEEQFKGRGVAYCATCDGEFFTGKEVFVVGGGFAAAEESVFLTKYASHVTILIRKDDFSCAAATAQPAKEHPKISIVPNSSVVCVQGDGAITSIVYRDNLTGEETLYENEDGIGVFVFAGYTPATRLFEGLVELDGRGYVVTDALRKTSVEGVYAAGDVCQKNLRQVVTATSDGAIAATELERRAKAMQEKTGLVPEKPQASQPAPAPAQQPEAQAASTGSELFDEAMLAQLATVFGRMESSLVLELHLDDGALSTELKGYMEELARLTSKLSVRVAQASDEADLPCVRVLREDGSWSGLAFHGVPGGHEFTSFVLGLYNAAGPGQPLDDASRERIAAISEPIRLQILVTLSCTMCPDLVVAAQRVASLSEQVSAEVYDANHFAGMKEKYRAMSVPCLVIDEGRAVSFGRKNIPQLLDTLQEAKG